jgi:nicotinamidase-related amidase
MNTALILVDIQQDYFPGGRMELEGPLDAVKAAEKLLNISRSQNIRVYHVQHVSMHPNAPFFLPETRGIEIHERVAPAPGEMVVIKHFPNSFRDTELKKDLEAFGIDHLIVAGMMSHMCIDATVRAAFDLGYEITIAQDACATRSMEWNDLVIPSSHVHGAFMAALGSVYARIMTVDMIVEELMG